MQFKFPKQGLNSVRLIKVLLALILRPQRMTKTSVICIKRDFDEALEVLNDFGKFHIEKNEENSEALNYDKLLKRTDDIFRNLNIAIIQLKIEKTGLLDIFKTDENPKIEINAKNWQQLLDDVEKESSKLKKNIDAHTISITNIDEEISNLQHLQSMLKILERFKINLEALEETQFINVIVATVSSKNIPELEIALETYPIIFYHSTITKNQEFVFIASSSKHKHEISDIVKNHHAKNFQLPKEMPKRSADALEKIDEKITELLQNKKVVLSSLENLAEENKSQLLALRETTQNISNTLSMKQKSFETKHLVKMNGYIPKEEFKEFEKKIDNKLNRTIVKEESNITSNDLPTKIQNHFLIKPFETITKLYGIPHYDEVDPTPLIAISFPLLFGFMFGDAGHGLFLLTVGLILGILIKKNEGIRSFSGILAACGLGAIFAGLLFGEFFGKNIFPALWFDPFEDVTGFLIFTLIIGTVQIISGFVLDFINFVFKGNIIDAIATALPKILFYLGGIYLIAVYQLNFNIWIQGPILFPLIPFIFLIFGKPIILKILKKTGHQPLRTSMQGSLLERVFESGDLVTRLLSNTMSYARILALLMAHWALLLVTYTISDMVFQIPSLGIVLGTIIVIGGNIFVIAFEGLIVFIHTLRLHFYEWFSKFYKGDGIVFDPFKQSSKYTKLIFKK